MSSARPGKEQTTRRSKQPMNSDNAITKLTDATRLLSECRTIPEAKQYHDMAEAGRVFAQMSGLGTEAQNYAVEIKLRAERRMGEMLKQTKKNKGGRPEETGIYPDTGLPPTLEEIGISKVQSSRWQAMAAVPAEKFEAYVADNRKDRELTTAGVMDLVKDNRKIEKVNTLPFDPQAFNIWNYPDRNPAFGIEYPGNIPGDIIQNLLWLYTQENSIVVDPFAGGGVTQDVCRWWNEKMWPVMCLSLDALPSRPEIIKNDITTGYPKSAQDAALVFLDPPYWKQKRGDYDGGNNLANMPLEEFDIAMEKIVRASLATLADGGRVALLIGATRDGCRYDHAAELLYRLNDVELEERIIVPYSTQQAAPYHVAAAKNGKLLLNRYRDLMVWQK
jgi:hypothetical protein